MSLIIILLEFERRVYYIFMINFFFVGKNTHNQPFRADVLIRESLLENYELWSINLLNEV